jgi:hypothetical protein
MATNATPTITFQVNLTPPNSLSWSQPFASSFASTIPSQISTWFPDLILDNHDLKNGNQFTVSGIRAIYLKNNFTTGPYAFLTVISTVG